MLIGEI